MKLLRKKFSEENQAYSENMPVTSATSIDKTTSEKSSKLNKEVANQELQHQLIQRV